MAGHRPQTTDRRPPGGAIRIALLLSACCCVLSAVFCPPVNAEELKVGYADMAKLFDSYERTKRSESLLEQKGQQKEEELEKRLTEIKGLREGLELLSTQARDTRAREIDRKADELRRFGKYTRQELLQERDRVAQVIVEEIQRTVQDYATANGFSIILDQRLLLYGRDAHDVTDAVLKLLNASDMARAKHSRGR